MTVAPASGGIFPPLVGQPHKAAPRRGPRNIELQDAWHCSTRTKKIPQGAGD